VRTSSLKAVAAAADDMGKDSLDAAGLGEPTPLTEEQMNEMMRRVPGTNVEAISSEDLMAQTSTIDSLADDRLAHGELSKVCRNDSLDRLDESEVFRGDSLESPSPRDELPHVFRDDSLESPSQRQVAEDVMDKPGSCDSTYSRGTDSQVDMPVQPQYISQQMAHAQASGRGHVETEDGGLGDTQTKSNYSLDSQRNASLNSKSMASLSAEKLQNKIRGLGSSGVAAMENIPAWMINPALGGFNPLPPRQALHMSRCTRYVKRRDQPESFTEALVRQAEKMIENDKNFYRRGSIAGWKIKPVTASKTVMAISRVGGVRLKSSAVPDGAGFFFDENRSITPNTQLAYIQMGGLIYEQDSFSSATPFRAQSRTHGRALKHLVTPLRPSSLPADGNLPLAGQYLFNQQSFDSTFSGDQPHGFRSSAPSPNVLTRPSRVRRKLPLEGLLPKGSAGRPPPWLEPLSRRVILRNIEENSQALGPDVYLKHVREAQRQPDAGLAQQPPEFRQGQDGNHRQHLKPAPHVFPEQSSRTGLLR